MARVEVRMKRGAELVIQALSLYVLLSSLELVAANFLLSTQFIGVTLVSKMIQVSNVCSLET